MWTRTTERAQRVARFFSGTGRDVLSKTSVVGSRAVQAFTAAGSGRGGTGSFARGISLPTSL